MPQCDWRGEDEMSWSSSIARLSLSSSEPPVCIGLFIREIPVVKESASRKMPINSFVISEFCLRRLHLECLAHGAPKSWCIFPSEVKK